MYILMMIIFWFCGGVFTPVTLIGVDNVSCSCSYDITNSLVVLYASKVVMASSQEFILSTIQHQAKVVRCI